MEKILADLKKEIQNLNSKIDQLTTEIMSIRVHEVKKRPPEYYGKE